MQGMYYLIMLIMLYLFTEEFHIWYKTPYVKSLKFKLFSCVRGSTVDL